ncbi:hypothetical protein L1987_26122 [Smallanthus sonchifolius]|uniref:Uncharacterized protein n=1 Tax=Smallanthus sonchifolius TaxID=185202 RepID=A0ACB9I8G3_9ASTR|nr:hypothetical protein L1987_26122 [Smallanthus sonchifolius]
MEQEPIETRSLSSLMRSDEYNGENKGKSSSLSSKFPLTFWEVAGASGVVLSFAVGLLGVYLTLPDSDYSFLKLPRTLEDLHILSHLQLKLACVTLVVFAATAGASSCYFLSNLIGRPLISSLWPDKLVFFQDQVAKRREGLLNYMLFLRLTPTLPNMFINVASPIVNVPYHIFLLATCIGLIPAAYVTVRAGITLGELQSIGDLYDITSIGTLFLIGLASITPTLIGKKMPS